MTPDEKIIDKFNRTNDAERAILLLDEHALELIGPTAWDDPDHRDLYSAALCMVERIASRLRRGKYYSVRLPTR